MSVSGSVLKYDEKAIYDLRSLYTGYGYSLYKVSKFEEYDLYAHNKSFLVSSNILSFTDTNGRLLALKPDVTLSIVKNISDERSTHKLCYNETVYRTSADSDGFKEIMQTGLECIGDIDVYSECEVITLAVKSLDAIGREYVLDLSHMGLVDGLLSEAGIDDADKAEFIGFIKSKNVHSIKALCESREISKDMAQRICALTEMYLPIGKALSELDNIVVGEKMKAAQDSLKSLYAAIDTAEVADKIYLDFSVVNDVNYYDGICFKGFINGVPDSVLSGGRYDKLLARLGKKSGAIGFAVYLDRLERYNRQLPEYDVDTVLVYGDDSDVRAVIKARKELSAEGRQVLVCRSFDSSLRYREGYKITDGGIVSLEADD